MSYICDEDLKFLETVPIERLKFLEDLFKEKASFTNGIKSISSDNPEYRKRIMEEIQLFGGNSFMNLFRFNKGVKYKEILCDICDKMDIKKSSSVEDMEKKLVAKILKKLRDYDKKELVERLGAEEAEKLISEYDLLDKLYEALSHTTKMAVIILLLEESALRSFFTRSFVRILTGPIGWIITGIWAATDIAGPAYRVTIPACFIIAILRIESKLQENQEDYR